MSHNICGGSLKTKIRYVGINVIYILSVKTSSEAQIPAGVKITWEDSYVRGAVRGMEKSQLRHPEQMSKG